MNIKESKVQRVNILDSFFMEKNFTKNSQKFLAESIDKC